MSNLEGEFEELFLNSLELEQPRMVTVYRIIPKEKLGQYLDEGVTTVNNVEVVVAPSAQKETLGYRAKEMTEDIFD